MIAYSILNNLPALKVGLSVFYLELWLTIVCCYERELYSFLNYLDQAMTTGRASLWVILWLRGVQDQLSTISSTATYVGDQLITRKGQDDQLESWHPTTKDGSVEPLTTKLMFHKDVWLPDSTVTRVIFQKLWRTVTVIQSSVESGLFLAWSRKSALCTKDTRFFGH